MLRVETNCNLAKYGARLLEQGYQVIPIKPGSKAPYGDDWQKIRATEKQLQTWKTTHTRAGVGILTRLTPAVDLDLLDEKMALAMQAYVEEHFGFAPVRIGFAPKRLMPFRAETPFSKVNSKTFIDPFGDPEISHTGSGNPNGDWRKVEILGDGNQFVAYHIHPDTGRPYEWVGKNNPLTVKHQDLPVLDAEGAAQIVAEFERLAVKAGWTVKPGATTMRRLDSPAAGRRVAHDDVFAADKAKTDISDDDLHRKLLLVPGAEDYETWVQIGMALYHQYDGGDDGRDLWHEWSQTADNYDADALDEKWSSFDVRDKGRTPVTARLIIKLADEKAREVAVETFRDIKVELEATPTLDDLKATCEKVKHIQFDVFQRQQIVGMVKAKFKALTKHMLTVGDARKMVAYENPKPKEIPRWLEGWVYCTDDAGFYSTKKHYAMSTEAFNACYGRWMLTPKDVLEGKSSPESSASAFALHNKQITVVQRRMYMPGEDDIFHYNGKPHVNSYDGSNIPEMPLKLTRDELAAVETSKAHLEHLFENETDRRALLDTIAYLVQNPTKRLRYAVLMQGVEEDGKSWFAGLLSTVLGPENVKNLNAEALNEKFNGWSEGTRIVFVEEVKLHGHNRYDVLNKVKPLITNLMIPVRRMQTDIYEAVNMATYFLTTNFKDALPLDSNDSRYLVLFSRFQNREQLEAFNQTDTTYYDRLYAALEHGGALRKWLIGHRLSTDFRPQKRAPMTAGKREMIEMSKPEEVSAVEDILRVGGPGLDSYVLSLDTLAGAMAEYGCDVPYGRAMNQLLTSQGFSRVGRMRIGDQKPWIWSRHPGRFTNRDGTINTLLVKNWLAAEI